MKKATYISLLTIISLLNKAEAQDSGKIYLTTSIGLLSPAKGFANAYKTSLALNSGVEFQFRHLLFAQLVIDFNAVKYNQQFRDNNNDFLFQKTNSSILLAGVNFGRNFLLNKDGKIFSSLYQGFGYVNIGEPRLTVNLASGIIEQNVTRMKGVYGKTGLRLGYKTSSKFLQTIYLDGSYWYTNVIIQKAKAQAFSLYIGTRIGF